MASRRKPFSPSVRAKRDAQLYAASIAALLDGTVKADKLIETRDGRGRLRLAYDDPNG